MEHNAASPSLLPYLASAGAGLLLRLPLTTEDPALLERLPCPFQIIIDSDPLIRLYEAYVSSDGESTLTRLFLLVQRDQYRIGAQDLWPITNRTIDDFWQETFSAYQGQASWKRPFLFGGQVHGAGRLIPCRPLLFCKRRGSFFHPPCPACGQALELCTDDELLSQVGLSPYSTSLRRYLFCPACLAGGKIPEFYVYERDRETSPVLKDRHELFRACNRPLENSSPATGLPCPRCAESGGCYGADQRALTNIVPFSFYPFYLLTFEAASLPALDFAALVAGAAPDQLEASLAARGEEGRVRCIRSLGEQLVDGASFLFADEERWFLEVLYLKLSLLGDLARLVFSGFLSDRRPDLGFPVDQVWVELSNVGGLLPSFWNFRSGPLALLAHQPAVPQAPPDSGLHLLGLGWMAVLLANSGQDISQVYRALSEEMAAPRPADFTLPLTGTFAPGNIFWNPGTRTVSEHYRPLWAKALGLGCSLLGAGVGSALPWSKEEFLAQVDELRHEVRTGLFQAGGVPAEETNEAVHQILVGISRRWLPVLERAAKAPAKPVPKAEPEKGKAGEEIPGTVMISPEALAKVAAPAAPAPKAAKEPPPKTPAKAKVEEEIPATVMISPEALAKVAAPPKPEMPPKPAKEPPRPAPQQPPKPPVKAKAEEEEIPGTVMISPEALAKVAAPPRPEMPPKPAKEPPRPAPQPPPRPPAKAKAEEEEIPATVMISPEALAKVAAPPKPEMPPKPAKEPPRPAPRPPKPPVKAKADEEEIPATVMISPGAMPKIPGPPSGASQAPGEAPKKTPGKKAEEPPSDDFVLKTVFISPERRKDKDSEQEQ